MNSRLLDAASVGSFHLLAFLSFALAGGVWLAVVVHQVRRTKIPLARWLRAPPSGGQTLLVGAIVLLAFQAILVFAIGASPISGWRLFPARALLFFAWLAILAFASGEESFEIHNKAAFASLPLLAVGDLLAYVFLRDFYIILF